VIKLNHLGSTVLPADPSVVSSVSQGKLRPVEVAQLPSPPNSAVSPSPHPAARNGTTHEYRTEKKGPLFQEMLEVSGGGICWGIREGPAGNSFLNGAPWGLELDFSPAEIPS